MRSLENRWFNLLDTLGFRGGVAAAQRNFTELQNAYSQPHRYYHTWAHIEQCFEAFDVFSQSGSWLAVQWALFNHDRVYAVHRPEAEFNEHYSALDSEKQGRQMGLSPGFLARGKRLVMVTRKHKARTLEEQVICDVDLSILGQPEAVFDGYELQIRQEYQHVEWDTYRTVRSQILAGLLQRSSIYYLPVYQQMFQEQAEANIRRSLDRLAA